MKNLYSVLFTLFVVTLFTSCSKEEKPDGVYIRVENSSSVDYSEILISSGFETVEFGVVQAGNTSEYKEFETAYRYGYVNLLADGEEFVIQPIDYVGETPLSNGYYTYKLSLDTSNPSSKFLGLELVVD